MTDLTQLRSALAGLLEEVESLEGMTFSRDLDPWDAEACWEDAITRAKNILTLTEPSK